MDDTLLNVNIRRDDKFLRSVHECFQKIVKWKGKNDNTYMIESDRKWWSGNQYEWMNHWMIDGIKWLKSIMLKIENKLNQRKIGCC